MHAVERHRAVVEALEDRRMFAQGPLLGSPFAVGPGVTTTMQAEQFDVGGEGFAYHDSTAGNTGVLRTDESVEIRALPGVGGEYRISDTVAGEWLEYTLDVAQAGQYTLQLRVASYHPGATVRAEVIGAGDLTGDLTAPDTNSQAVFTTISKSVTLPAGEQVLRFVFAKNNTGAYGAALDWLKLSAPSNPETPPPPPPPPPPDPPDENETVLDANDAAYVNAGSSAGANFGAAPELLVKKSSVVNYNRESYLSFDLAGAGSITSGKLRLYGRLNDTQTASVTVNVHSASGASWSEESITYENRPATSGTVVGSFKVTGTTSRSYELDISGFLRGEQAAGRNIVTLVLKGAVNTGSTAVFASDDAAANKPQLLLNGTSAADPLAALQRAYLDHKYGMFIHFGHDTFTDSVDNFPPNVNTFAPSAVDTDQWAAVAKASGMKYAVFTTKHHDGYALWDTNQTAYDVASSDWYAGEIAAGREGDVVRRYVDSFRREGLAVGLYYSILDRKAGITSRANATWATNYVKAELTQLLTNYGPIQVLWTDGWKWSVGYTAVRWQEVYDHIKAISPNTLLLENNHEGNLVHTDIAGWENPYEGVLPAGNTLPAELCDTLRGDGTWSYRTFDPPVHDTQTLLATRELANARNANYLLNVGPNRAGVIPQVEVDALADLQAAYLASL